MRLFLLLLLFVNLSYPLQAQSPDMGLPFIHAYSFKELNRIIPSGVNSQSWSITQDNQGVIYIGNRAGAITYNGSNWQTFPSKNGSTVRCLAFDSASRRIYAGAVGDFGYFQANKQGKQAYHSYNHLLPDSLKNLGNVWKVYPTPQGIYYQSFKSIIRIENDSVLNFIPPPTSFHLSYFADGKIYVMDRKQGLHLIDGNNLLPVKGSEPLTGKLIYSIIDMGQGKKWVITRKKGIWIWENDTFTHYPTNIESLITTAQIYHATRLSNGQVAIATILNGLFIFNADGTCAKHLTVSDGLNSNGIFYVFEDAEQGIWLAHDNGISRIDWNSPIRIFDERQGLNGTAYRSAVWKGDTYIGNAKGLSILKQDASKPYPNAYFKPLPTFNTPVWDLLVLEDCLLAASSQGIYQIDKNGEASLLDKGYALRVTSSPSNPSLVYLSRLGKFQALIKKENEWIISKPNPKVTGQVYSAVEHQGSLWLASTGNGVMRFDISSQSYHSEMPIAKLYTEEDGLLNIRGNRIYLYENNLVLGSKTGLFRYDSKNDRFVEDPRWNAPYNPQKKQTFGLSIAPDGTIWRGEGKDNASYGVQQADGSYQWITAPFNRIPKNSTQEIIFSEDIVSFYGVEGIFSFKKPLVQQTLPKQFEAIISNIKLINEDSILYGGFGSPPPTLSLSYEQNSIEITVAASSFASPIDNQYQFWLEGGKEGWSEWTQTAVKEYIGLWEGEYILHIRAKNVYNQTIEKQLPINISPPFYRSPWAIGIYLIISALGIWAIVHWNTYRLAKENQLLEKTVSERTEELRLQKEDILTQNEELQQQQEEIITQRDYIGDQNTQLKEQHERITDSIRYAQTIQEGVLPFPERLGKHIEEHFILYHPKDIVSGDFYWFEKAGNTAILAVADCTGHGVPGAFMSMLGIAILNDIVLKEQITEPHLILHTLNTLLRRVLKTNNDSRGADGMDVVICAWEVLPEGHTELRFSGAKRPLYYTQKGVLKEIQGTRRSIGSDSNDKGKPFESHTIIINEPTNIYLSSDGYADQNGAGKETRKISTQILKNLLLKNHHQAFSTQKHELESFLDEYMQGTHQRDDITILGIRVG